MIPGQPDDAALDDAAALADLDRDGMLLAVATAGAQVREALVLVEPDTLAPLASDRPRAVVVTGMGGSGIAADVATAVAGRTCPVPVVAKAPILLLLLGNGMAPKIAIAAVIMTPLAGILFLLTFDHS